jgi:dTDP-4-dehydrorhamnose 3,5-epimerase
MGKLMGVILTPLKIIEGSAGNVMHALKATETSFEGFGEAYFSSVQMDAKKGWKKHRQMILNLVVVSGAIKFILFDDRTDSPSFQQFDEITLSLQNYQRLTVPAGIWMAFAGASNETNLLLNIASIPHDPLEAENLLLENNIIPNYRF